ncbi:MAG: hypothetical protein U0105_14370 [Candidatus Obscuribacterales bacterium]
MLTPSLQFAFGFEKDSNGEHVVSFAAANVEELVPPVSQEERLEWVRASYQRFIAKVAELDALRAAF